MTGDFMSTYEKAFNTISDTFESLKRSGIISSKSPFSEDTIILGSDSELDSLGFVTFISDLEERISTEEDKEVFLVLNDISDFNLNNPSLTAKALASYIAGLTKTDA
jgi:hypothetical protein